jgi:hypothetical protein
MPFDQVVLRAGFGRVHADPIIGQAAHDHHRRGAGVLQNGRQRIQSRAESLDARGTERRPQSLAANFMQHGVVDVQYTYYIIRLERLSTG